MISFKPFLFFSLCFGNLSQSWGWATSERATLSYTPSTIKRWRMAASSRRHFQQLTSPRYMTSTPITTDPYEDLQTGYKSGRILMSSAALILLVMPDRSARALFAAKMGGVAGYGLAALLCHILQGAHAHNRLGSDTYKRLHLGLLTFSAGSLLAVPGEAGFSSSASGAIVLSVTLSLVRLFGVALAWRGWEAGLSAEIQTPQQKIDELRQGVIATVKGLRVQSAKKALAYRNVLFLVVMGALSSLFDGIFLYRYLQAFGRSFWEVSLKISAVARLGMIATLIYTLKDAAERDRLTGTTFIQLNFGVAAWAMLVALGQCNYPYGFAANRGVEMFAIGLPFLIKGYKSLKEKEQAAAAKQEAPKLEMPEPPEEPVSDDEDSVTP